MMATCTLHNLQTCLRNAVCNVLGDGGKDDDGEYKKNVMQMLHGAYNIQNYHEKDELLGLWDHLQRLTPEQLKFKKLEEPVLT